MMKLFLLAILAFGSFLALGIFFPSSTHTVFTVGGYHITWMMLGVCGVTFIGYKAIK